MGITHKKHIVIIGCGFGGLEAAKALRNADVDITLIDRTNHHLFQPLLYQVATAGLSAPAIAAPIRNLFRTQRNVTTLMGDVTAIDAVAQTVTIESADTAASTVQYDHLIKGLQTNVPGVSPAAKQMGRSAAQNILLRMAGKPTPPFRYKDYGNLATIGRNAAVVDLASPLGHFKFSGYFAWLFWLFAHIYFLIGFRNRFVVLLDWASAYVSFARHARVVVGSASARSETARSETAKQ